jgi:CHASE3 domain sensor protein
MFPPPDSDPASILRQLEASVTRSRSLVYLIAGSILLLALVAVVAVFTIEAQRSAAERATLFRASVRLGLLFSALQDVEIGQRGYLITHDPDYLKPYEDAVRMLPERTAAVDEVLSSRPEQQVDFARVKQLIPQKLDELNATIALISDGRDDDALNAVRSDRGREIMDEIRSLFERMRNRQAESLANTSAEFDANSTWLRYGVIAAGILVLLLAALAFLEKRRQRLAIEGHARDIEAHSMAMELTNEQLRSEIE